MAVDTSVFQTQGAAGGGPVSYVMKGKDGAFTEVEIPREQWKAPTDGRHLLVFKGIGKPYERTDQFGTFRKVRCAFLVKAPGTMNHGCMFSQPLNVARMGKDGMWHTAITNKSATGQMIACIRGKEIEEGEPINVAAYLNGEFSAAVLQNTVTNAQGLVEVYANIVKDSWRPASEQPAAQPASAAPAAANPFLDND